MTMLPAVAVSVTSLAVPCVTTAPVFSFKVGAAIEIDPLAVVAPSTVRLAGET